MANSKQTKKFNLVSLTYNAIKASPIPTWITRAKDGTYVDINEAGIRYVGLKREDIIGRTTIEVGVITKEQRQLLIDEIKKDGFSRNIPIKLKFKNQVIQALFAAYKFKQGNEDFLFGFLYSIPNCQPHIKSSKRDLFYKLALLDLKYIKERLKQYNLTPRQKELTVLSAEGKSNRDIAKELCISEHTVKDHLKEIFQVIGIRHRSQLVPKLLNLS